MNEHGNTPRPQADGEIEVMLGKLLRLGVLVAAAVVAAGGLLLIISRGNWTPDYAAFHDANSPLRSVGGILREAYALRPDGIVQTGILLLVATPVLRVVFSLFAFARQRDWLYVVLTLVVLAVLSVGLAGWKT
ncbi:MAG TPA: DUF1634 domain-containing protein [Bacteroidota bacterium]|nr:DUF1634 domain-containing protein [Bacteroidota bacterium]